MNYKKIHDAIIERAKGRKYSKGVHERHHIIPISMGGSNQTSNLVVLTYKEHFLVHWLLTKITDGENRRKMLYALYYITKNPKNSEVRIVSSRHYKIARKAHSKALIGNSYGVGKSSLKGYKHTAEAVQNMRSAKLGKSLTDEHRNNISKSLTDNPNVIKSRKGNTNAKGNAGRKFNDSELKELKLRMMGNTYSKGKTHRSRPVLCLTDGRVHSSGKAAASFYACQSGNIAAVCRGERRHANGYTFVYVGKGENAMVDAVTVIRAARLGYEFYSDLNDLYWYRKIKSSEGPFKTLDDAAHEAISDWEINEAYKFWRGKDATQQA